MTEAIEGEIVKEPHKIATKFKVGDEVFIIHENKAKREKIIRIHIEQSAEKTEVVYFFHLPGQQTQQGILPFMVDESLVFELKQDLYNSIMDL